MAHTYLSHLVHCVFSTKERRSLIRGEMQARLWAFLGGIARKNGFQTLAAGGTDNHVHVLIALPATMPLAKAVQLLKGGSSKWMNEISRGFAWQEGYGAFSVGISQVPDTVAYINAQAAHHAKRDFQGEFLAFLKKHGIDYDPRYVLG
jgi:putative transposase